MAEHEQDRSQEATPYKLQKARERGQVARSRDVVSAAVLTAAMAYLAWQGWPVWRAQFLFDQAVLVQAAQAAADPHALWPLVERATAAMLWLGLPFFATLVVAAVLGNLLQTGPVFSFHPLQADLTRLNPAQGFKNAFGLQMLFNGLRAVVKMVLLVAVAWIAIDGLEGQFRQLSVLPVAGLTESLLDAMGGLGLKLALALWIVALADLAFSRREFAKKMRMSHRELQDEVKQRDGDPRVRARLRELRREMRKRTRALRNTRNADVLIANPTHFAVALRYEHGKMAAPEVVAKGAGLVAAVMRAIAARHGIQVVQNPRLARKLFHELEVEAPVPPEHFADVARIIVWVLAARAARQRATA